ncbi:amino acid ABC transporter permease [Mesorhizobium sp. B3-1-7]|uniref:amino acid ABC transporter permease n=1 Tax=Mesorhizobium sp. B3-1-7 TaxID=2589894 RepID=UPI00112E411F|nr:amino acid ABC transporter permease [Mesorhizobium sp. B3-1-7]TPI58172.1 amino acid ABC transporter permease [Mesorhizobium sp. B3-1-7]
MNEHQDEIIPARHPGRVVAAVLCITIAGLVIVSMLQNPAYQWAIVVKYLSATTVLTGLGWTLGLTIASMTIGVILGIIAALMRQSANPVLATIAAIYIWLFRGVPLLVQLIFWYNLAALYPAISIGLPFAEPIGTIPTNDIITPLVAALLGLGLNEGAYMAEIVRSGLLSVDPGQREAAQSLGMSPAHTLRRIIIPQALRIIVPPTGNEVIGMLKATSLVSVLSISDLLYSVQGIYGRTLQTIPLLIVASIWYLVASTILTTVQRAIERHYGRGHRSSHHDALSGLFSLSRPGFLLGSKRRG